MTRHVRSILVVGAGFAAALGATAALRAQPPALPDGYVQPGAPVEPGHAPGMKVHEAVPAAARTFELDFTRGDEIMSGITELAQRHGIAAGYVTGLGGLSGAVLGWGNPEVGGIKKIPVAQQSELASLVGDISLRDGKPHVHAHAVLALSDGSTRGGHVVEAHVSPVAEVVVVATEFSD